MSWLSNRTWENRGIFLNMGNFNSLLWDKGVHTFSPIDWLPEPFTLCDGPMACIVHWASRHNSLGQWWQELGEKWSHTLWSTQPAGTREVVLETQFSFTLSLETITSRLAKQNGIMNKSTTHWANYLTSLSLRFLTCKMWITPTT